MKWGKIRHVTIISTAGLGIPGDEIEGEAFNFEWGQKIPGFLGIIVSPWKLRKFFCHLSKMSKKLWISEAKKINIRENY